MDCTVIILAGGQGLRMGGLGQLSAKAALVAYDWPLLIRALHQMQAGGFSRVIVSTNATFYEQLSTLVSTYLARVGNDALDITVIDNPAHARGPLPAFAAVLERIETRRSLLVLADEFLVGNPFVDFAAVMDEDADYLGVAPPFDPRELKRGGLVYCNQHAVTAIVEKPQADPGADGLRWTGVALFDSQLLDDFEPFFSHYAEDLAVGEIFEYRRARGRTTRAIAGTDFINVNSPDHLLIAGLYVAMENHQDKPELQAAFEQAVALLRTTL